MAPSVDEQTSGVGPPSRNAAAAGSAPRRVRRVPARGVLSIAVLLLFTLLPALNPPPTFMDLIRRDGELRVAMLPAPASFYSGAQAMHGFDRELVSAFAHKLGVRARFITVRNRREMHDLLLRHKVHLAAGLMPIAGAAPPGLAYGPSYLATRQLVVQRRGEKRARTAPELRGLALAAAGAAQRRVLEQYLPQVLGYRWSVHEQLESDELLQMLADAAIDCAIMPSTEYAALRRFFPDTRVAFDLGAPAPVAWIYPREAGPEMWRAQLALLRELRANGEFATLDRRYFGPQRRIDPQQTRAFLAHYDRRLPHYRAAFRATARRQHLDWLLLAAVSYQESHWRADARSPTGVRGLMMLTRATARALAVDRLDPHASIHGAALYLRTIKAKLPAAIPDPDRTWLALAAYNIGPAHLADARKLTAQAGRDPNKWAEVREFLPLLARPSVARTLRHGRARGHQAVHFVENVRRYQDLLRRLESAPTREALAAREPASARAML